MRAWTLTHDDVYFSRTHEAPAGSDAEAVASICTRQGVSAGTVTAVCVYG
ncbi:hypothetical protein [Bacillus subtilis]